MNDFPIIEDMPNQARVWIYQADRQLSVEEVNEAENYLSSFVQSWDSHGAPVVGTFQIYKQQFIILCADESRSSVSGCSIDKSVSVIRQLQDAFNVNFLDKSLVAFEQDEQVQVVPFTKIKQLVEEQVITEATNVFVNTVTTVEEWKNDWKIPASSSWLSRFF